MRSSKIKRNTNETKIDLSLSIDGTGKFTGSSSVPFFDHMLDQICRFSKFDIDLIASGDIEIDYHHITEDIGLALGKAFNEAIGDKMGIRRFAGGIYPMDESMTMFSLDISGRPFLNFKCDFPTELIGNFPTELVLEFLKAFTTEGRITLHIDNLEGVNSHHICENIFKGLGLLLGDGCKVVNSDLPSTKGVL